MKCTQIRKYLIPYSEGTLAEDLSRRVEEHISKCESCAHEANELWQTVDVLRHTEYPQMEPAYDLRSRVMAQIAQEPVRKSWWSSRLPAYSAAAAALLMFAVVVISVENPFVRSREAARAPSMTTKAPGGSQLAEVPKEAQTKAVPSIPAPIMTARKPSADFTLQERKADKRELGARALAKASPEIESHEFYAEAPVGPAGPAGPAAGGVATAQSAPEPALTAQAPYGGAQQYPREQASNDALGMGNISPDYAGKPKASASATAADKVAKLESNLKEYPTSRSTLESLTYAYRDADRPEDEYATATKLTKMYPDNAQYWFERAQAAERSKMSHTAMTCYRRAIELKLSGQNLETAKGRLKAIEEATSR